VRRIAPAGVFAAACLIHGAPAHAQSSDALPGRFEIAAGASWVAPLSLGSRDANETTGTLTTARLFSTSTTLAGAPAVDGRVGVRLTRSLMVEGEASLSQPEVRVEITNDVEAGRVTVTPTERIEQFTVGGGLVWYVPVRASRVAPFLAGGGGYLRQLHETATLVVTGRYYQFGGGVVYPLQSRSAARLKAMGLRLEARALIRVNGVAFDSSAHLTPTAGASFFLRF
jgi:hypothetical protein